jgi:hypothetical protein
MTKINLPAIIPDPEGLPTIAPAAEPPKPTPLGLDKNFYFRRGVVKSAAIVLGVDPAFTEKPSPSWLSDGDGVESTYCAYPRFARGWAVPYQRLVTDSTPALEYGRRDHDAPEKVFQHYADQLEAVDMLEQIEGHLPAAAERLAEALALATAGFVRDEVESFLAGRRVKEKGASGEAFFADVLGATMDTNATCYAVAAAFQNLRGVGGRDFVDPQSNDAAAMLGKWSENADYAGRIVAGLLSLPPASELRASIERKRLIFRAELDRQAEEEAERKRQAEAAKAEKIAAEDRRRAEALAKLDEEERQRRDAEEARRRGQEEHRAEGKMTPATRYDPVAAAAGSQWGASGDLARKAAEAQAASRARRAADPILSRRPWLPPSPRRDRGGRS